MNAPHRIRLHGPWSRCLLAADARETRIQIPESDLEAARTSFAAGVHFTRRFHRPLRLPESEVVCVVFSALGGDAEVRLNEQLLGTSHWPARLVRFDLTGRLQPTNVLQVTLRPPAADVGGTSDGTGPPWGCLGPVHLSFGEAE